MGLLHSNPLKTNLLFGRLGKFTAAFCAGLLAFNASAAALNIGDPSTFGCTTIDLGLTPGVIYYLFVKYDGSKLGSVVWFVGDLSGSVTIPKSWAGLALSRGTLFKEEGGGGSVPDTGATAILWQRAQPPPCPAALPEALIRKRFSKLRGLTL